VPHDTSFERALHLHPVEDGCYRTEIPDGWQQGRGAFGGLVMAVLVRAIEHAEPDTARQLRALTGEIPAPVLPGSAVVRVEVLRRGARVTTVRALLMQHGKVLAQATGVLGAAREDVPSRHTIEVPAMRPWHEVEPIPFVPGLMPTFSRHMEMRNLGAIPFQGDNVQRTEGWIRPRAAMGPRGAAWLAAMVDVWWPCALVTFHAPRPTATITYTLECVGDFEGLDADAPVYHRAHSPIVRDGYAVEFRELWGSDGRLLALNQQTFVIIQ